MHPILLDLPAILVGPHLLFSLIWTAVAILVRFLPMSVSLLEVQPLQQMSPSQRILKPVNVGVPFDTLDGSDQP